MSGLFRKKNRHVNEAEHKKKISQESDGSDSPRPFLLTSGCQGGRNPLDWATIPSSIQDQFPHWKETSVPSPILPLKSPEREKPRSESFPKRLVNGTPDNSIPYIVMDNDTLVSIALKFDTSTSMIAQTNKLPLMGSFPIYPGMLLYIPDDSSDTSSFAIVSPPPTSPESNDKGGSGEQEPQEGGGTTQTKNEETAGGEGEEEDRQEEFVGKGRSSSLIEIEDEVTDTHVYVSSKFMSEDLCIHGFLVINTQSIMFKPNDEDPLVEDNGPEPYEVWLPLNEIVYAYITREYSPPCISSPPPVVSPPVISNSQSQASSTKHHAHSSITTTTDNDLIDSSDANNDENDTENEKQNEAEDENEKQNEADNENEKQNETEDKNHANPEGQDEIETDSSTKKQNGTESDAATHKLVEQNGIESDASHESVAEDQNERINKQESESGSEDQLRHTGMKPDVIANATHLIADSSADQNEHGAATNQNGHDADCDQKDIVQSQEKEDLTEHKPEHKSLNQNEHETRDQNEHETAHQNQNETVGQNELETRKQNGDETADNNEIKSPVVNGDITSPNKDPYKTDIPPPYTAPPYFRRDTLNSLFLDSFEQSSDSIGGGAVSSIDELSPAMPSPWFFLYCRLSQSSQHNSSVSVVGMKIPVATVDKHTRVQKVRTWFVFAIPKRRVEDIYNFLCTHHPRLNEPGQSSTVSEPKMVGGRLEIINIRGTYSDESLLVSESHFASSWEIFSVGDVRPPHIECMNVEDRLPLPNMNVPSNLLTDTHIRKLMPHLVSNAVGHDWHSVYSTYNDGFSLHTLYRNMTQFEFEDTASLLVVQDSYGKIFGAMVPCPLRMSDRFYGTGDSFLFSFDGDNVLVYPWTGENDYVIKGSPDSIAFGSGDGFFGLWLDENLYHGSSSKCLTYNNEPLATSQDYYINGLEAWGFTT